MAHISFLNVFNCLFAFGATLDPAYGMLICEAMISFIDLRIDVRSAILVCNSTDDVATVEFVFMIIPEDWLIPPSVKGRHSRDSRAMIQHRNNLGFLGTHLKHC